MIPVANDMIMVAGRAYLIVFVLHSAGQQKFICFRDGKRTDFMLSELPNDCIVQRAKAGTW